MNENSVTDAKRRLRRDVSALLAGLGPGRRRAAAVALAENLATVPAVRAARTIMAFLSLPTEISTWPTILWAWQGGKRIAVPRIEPPPGRGPDAHAGSEVVPVLLEPAEATSAATHPAVRPGALGIQEVPGGRVVPVAEIGVVLAPCLAVDRAGHRLGKGGGYYDRFLARDGMRASVIAVGFHEQVVDAVPVAAHDRRVAMVVTDGGVCTLR